MEVPPSNHRASACTHLSQREMSRYNRFQQYRGICPRKIFDAYAVSNHHFLGGWKTAPVFNHCCWTAPIWSAGSTSVQGRFSSAGPRDGTHSTHHSTFAWRSSVFRYSILGCPCYWGDCDVFFPRVDFLHDSCFLSTWISCWVGTQGCVSNTAVGYARVKMV